MPAPEGFKKRTNPITKEDEIVPRAEGWNMTRNERLKLWEMNNRKDIQQMIYAQSQLPESLRDYSGKDYTKQGGVQPPDRPGYNALSLDIFSTGSYASGAWLKNEQDKRLGKEAKAGIKDAIFPSDVLLPESKPTAESRRWEKATKYNPIYQVLPRWGKKIYTDIAWDPTTFITSGIGGATKFISSAGKVKGLTSSGVKAYTELLKQYPRIKVVTETGEELWHINPEVRHLMSRILRENPNLMVQKEGLRFIYSNIELIPRKYLPWSYVGSVASKTGGRVNELYVGLKERVKGLTRKVNRNDDNFISALRNIGKKDYSRDITRRGVQSLVNLQATIAMKTGEQLAELNSLERQAKNIFGKDAGRVLSTYIEDPNVRNYGFMSSIRPIADRIMEIHASMVIEEKKLGLLTSEKQNYIRHLVTNQYKKMMSLTGSKVKSAAYSLHRDIDKTIMNANFDSMNKYGVNVFTPDGFKATAYRIKEDIATVETAKYFDFIATTFGRTKKDARQLRGFVQSTLPGMKNVWLPKDMLRMLEDDAVIKNMMKAQPKEGLGKLALNAYDSYNNLWARMNTVLFPEFHARNIYGSMWKNIMSGVNPVTWLKAKAKGGAADDVMLVDIFGVPHTKKEMHDLGTKMGIYDQVGPAGETVGKAPGDFLFKYPMMIGRGIESRVREMMFFEAVERGDDIATIEGRINRYHFDYGKVYSELEEDILKRIIPFYTWNRENRINEAYMMTTTPNRYSVFDKIMHSGDTQQSDVEKSYMPDWLKGGTIMPFGNNTWAGTGLPFEDITKLPYLFSGNASEVEGRIGGTMLYPIVKVPIETYMGKEMWSGKNITNIGEYLVKTSPFSRIVNTADYISNPDKTTLQKISKIGFGINIYNATDWIWNARNTPEGIVRQSIRRLNGKYRGCGF